MQIFQVVQRYGLPLAVALAVMAAMLLPLNLLTLQPLHHDEALYATWGLRIASGQDPWLSQTPIDKPPLFLYTLAGSMRLLGATSAAARLPALVATGLSVLLTFLLGRKLYHAGVGLLAGWLVALSPFTLAFAPTAFTDPMLVAFVLGSCLAAAHGRPIAAGLGSALAIATKQQGLFFVPLVAILLTVTVLFQDAGAARPVLSRLKQYLLRYGTALLLALVPAFAWDAARLQPSGFLQQSLANYGGLSTDIWGFGERWQGFIDLLYYGTASPLLNTVFLAGLPVLLLYDGWQLVRHSSGLTQSQSERTDPEPPLTDWLMALFIVAFVLLHALFSFQVWDRYLLGLMPFLALLLARILLLPWTLLKKHGLGRSAGRWRPQLDWAVGLALFILLLQTSRVPVQDAVQARYPLGSNSSALRGIEHIVAYLQGHVGAGITLYHRWLGTHWRFYLGDYPYDLRFWESPETLAATAQAGHLIALPAWQSDTTLRLALHRQGLRLHELARAYTPDGAPSILLYRIESLVSNPAEPSLN